MIVSLVNEVLEAKRETEGKGTRVHHVPHYTTKLCRDIRRVERALDIIGSFGLRFEGAAGRRNTNGLAGLVGL